MPTCKKHFEGNPSRQRLRPLLVLSDLFRRLHRAPPGSASTSRVWKRNHTSKFLWRRRPPQLGHASAGSASLSDRPTSKFMPCLYLGIWDPHPHLRGATVLKEAHALQCITAGPYNATPADLLRAGSVCGLGVDLLGFVSLALLPRLERLPTRTRSSTALRKSKKKVHLQVCPQACLYSRCQVLTHWQQPIVQPPASLAEAPHVS